MDMKDLLKDIGSYMKKYGFKRKGKLYFTIKNDIAFCLEFEKPGHSIYLAYYVIPLYIPHETRCFTYGTRTNLDSVFMRGNMYQNQHSLDEKDRLQTLVSYIEINVIPFFERFGNILRLTQFAEADKLDDYILCDDISRLRLLFLSYAFIGKQNEALAITMEYRIALQNANWLTDAVKEQRVKEIEDICYLLKEKPEEISAWYDEVIANSLNACSLM